MNKIMLKLENFDIDNLNERVDVTFLIIKFSVIINYKVLIFKYCIFLIKKLIYILFKILF